MAFRKLGRAGKMLQDVNLAFKNFHCRPSLLVSVNLFDSFHACILSDESSLLNLLPWSFPHPLGRLLLMSLFCRRHRSMLDHCKWSKLSLVAPEFAMVLPLRGHCVWYQTEDLRLTPCNAKQQLQRILTIHRPWVLCGFTPR